MFISKLKGMYRISVYRKDGSIRYEGDWFENIITNNGLNYLLSTGGSGWGTSIFVGSGTSTPTVSQTSLDNLLMTNNTNNSQTISVQGSAPYYSTYTLVKRFPAVPSGGYNISEVGVGASSTNLFSRALIQDSVGNPITLSLLQDEILEVTYQLRNYPSLTAGDYAQSGVDISGTSYTFTWRACGVTTAVYWDPSYGYSTSYAQLFTGAVGSVTAANPSGTGSLQVTGSAATYTNGTYYRQFTGTFGLTVANQTSASILINMGSSSAASAKYQAAISPSITKTGSQILALTWQQSVGRA